MEMFFTRRRIFVLDSLHCPGDNCNRMRIGACWRRVHGRGSGMESGRPSGCAVSSFPVVISDTKRWRLLAKTIVSRCTGWGRAIAARLDPSSRNRIVSGLRIWCRLYRLPWFRRCRQCFHLEYWFRWSIWNLKKDLFSNESFPVVVVLNMITFKPSSGNE